MSTSNAFEWLCGELEIATDLDRLAARGTVRLALKQSGLEPNAATGDQIAVVLDRVLPAELTNRGVDSAPEVCARIAARTSEIAPDAMALETPEAVFARLGS
jgi:hypothetical protein